MEFPDTTVINGADPDDEMDLPDVVVISGADPCYEKPLFDFARDVCKTEKISLLLEPDVDRILIGTDPLRTIGIPPFPPQDYELRDILRTRVRRRMRSRRYTGVFVSAIPLEYTNLEYEQYRQLALRGIEEVADWNMFYGLIAAYLNFDGTVTRAD